jgi:glycosyltransferase involved in cell wall biosynthesis
MKTDSTPTFAAAVVIATKNRLIELRAAVESALAQSVPTQVIVLDDASTDGTADAIANEYPQVLLARSDISKGYIHRRNAGAELTSAPVIFSIDDDAAFSSKFIVEQTLAEFDHPRIGAVAIPFINVNQSCNVWQRAPEADKAHASYSFIGTAHALRRDLFLNLGGYRESLMHQGEEEDYCARMLNAGYVVRCGASDPIHHFESPRRDWTKMDYYGARNKLLYSYWNVPWPYLPGHFAVTTFKTLTYSFARKRFLTRVQGISNALTRIVNEPGSRDPITPSIYRLSRKLKKDGPLELSKIENHLPEGRPLPPLRFTHPCFSRI